MPTIKLGQVRPVYRGEWAEETADYTSFDWVTYKGIAYIALQAVPATYQPDSQPDFWAVFGAKGVDGTQGPAGKDGKQGPAGKDGTQGAQGPQGEQGPVGPTGQQGPAGVQGPVGPAVPLSNSVSSASETDAASSKAVKTAYDTGVAAYDAGLAAQKSIDAMSALVKTSAAPHAIPKADAGGTLVNWGMRIVLTASLTIYVATTGNDTNDGLSSAKAFRTIQKAIDTACEKYDMNRHSVSIRVAGGMYEESIRLRSYVSSSGVVEIVGAGNTKTFVQCVTSASGIASTLSDDDMCFSMYGLLDIAFYGPKATNALERTIAMLLFARAVFVRCVFNNFEGSGGTISSTLLLRGPMESALQSCAFHGPATYHVAVDYGKLFFRDQCTFNGTMSGATIVVVNGGVVNSPRIHAGIVAGKRYEVGMFSTLVVGGMGANAFPGTIAGINNGGVYG